jgi:hypothetical protein
MNPTRPRPRPGRPEAHGPLALVLVGLVGLGAAACTGGLNPLGDGHDDAAGDPDEGGGDTWEDRLDERKVDYGAALRSAALRLTGDLPTLAEIKGVVGASDVPAAYRGQLAAYMDDPRFARQMVEFWRDTFKMGDDEMLDSAPIYAAQTVVEGRPYTDLLTATAGTCPTFDEDAGTFQPGECGNGAPAGSGLLGNPGVMRQFYSNLAFRRTRWVQEIFACTAFPAEVTTPTDVGGASVYTAPWPFESIAGYDNGGEIDFLDVSSVTCANCHATMNHLAPLFANFDEDGVLRSGIQVHKPTDGTPLAAASDWLPSGQATAWRLGVPTPDLAALGQAMAADPAIAECAVARTWNWAFGKTDIVDTLSVVPSEVIADQVAAFEANDYDLKQTILAVFTADDFIRF